MAPGLRTPIGFIRLAGIGPSFTTGYTGTTCQIGIDGDLGTRLEFLINFLTDLLNGSSYFVAENVGVFLKGKKTLEAIHISSAKTNHLHLQ
jgi:hypothetical protein